MIEAAPQAQPKTTGNARNVVDLRFVFSLHVSRLLRPFGWCWGSVSKRSCHAFLEILFNALPVPMLRQVVS